MTTESNTLGSVDATTAILEAELPRLEQHQQELGRKLATVTERLESVRAALGALRVLSAAPPVSLAVVTEDKPAAVLVPAARTETGPASVPASVEEAVAAPTRRRAAKSTAPRATAKTPRTSGAAVKRKQSATQEATQEAAPAADKPSTVKSRRTTAGKGRAAANGQKAGGKKSAPAAPAEDNGSLTAQVMAVVHASGSTPVRARDVAEALGRELTTGGINTVRSTLDRLVATSRAHRAGRGLYQAPLN